MVGLRALFPLDGSEPTYKAVEGALQRLAQMKDAEATFMVVMSKHLKEMPEDAAEYLKYDDEDEVFIREDEAKGVVEKAAAIAKKHKIAKTSTKMVVGKVYDAILHEAQNHDVLVMHRLSRNEFKEKMRGGVLEELCRNAPCDVWLVDTE